MFRRFCYGMALGIASGIAPAAAGAQGTFAFENVNVIPMNRETVLERQTVIVANGRITAVGPAGSTSVPSGATRIDGTGKFLMPGIAEMHGHIPGANSPLTPDDALFLYVAAGATTVRNMQGQPSHIPLRQRVESGEIIGPRLYLSAPPMSGNNVPDAATADRLVRAAKAAGYDHLKVHEGLSQDAYSAIAKTARELNMHFGGHVSAHVQLKGALAERQNTIDHLDEYVEALEKDDAPTKAQLNKLPAVLDHIDESKIPAIVTATRNAGVAVVPTMPLWEVLRGAHDNASLASSRAGLQYVPRQLLQAWENDVNNRRQQFNQDYSAREIVLRNKILKALSDGGVMVLMGSDAPQTYSVPGFSLQHEMETMVSAGMSPYQVLRSGTYNVAQYYGKTATAGTVEPGREADLLLLNANPLQNVRNVMNKSGVMIRGRWLPQSEIQKRLDVMAGSR